MKNTIQNHFDQYQLSKKQLQRLNNIQADSSSSWYVFLQKMPRIRVALALTVIVLVIVTFVWWQPWNHTTHISSLASEIVYHHNKQMVMEVESPSLENVRAYLAKLNFPLIESERLPSTDWELVGGRYCSLQGHMAAQLRMRNKATGKTSTLYQLLVPQNLSSLEGTFEDFEQGVKVEIWKERGLLLGVAQEN